MSIAPFPYIKYSPDPEDDLLRRTLIDLLSQGQPSVSNAPSLSEDIYLDPCLSGWPLEELEDENVKPGDDIIWEGVSDPLEDRPWDNPEKKGMLLLGLYIASPCRKIILFPNAIELVAGRNPEFLQAFGGDIPKARDALLRIVLLHEMSHWFTLDPATHGNRLSLTYNLCEQVDTKALGEGRLSGAELAETLAQLCTWLTLRKLAASASQADRTKDLLRAMLLIADPAATYHYQLFWFWLFLSGVVIPSDLSQSGNSQALDKLAKWAKSTNSTGCDDDLLTSIPHPGTLNHQNRLGFANPCRCYPDAFDALWETWCKDREELSDRLGGEDLIGVQDI